MVGLILGGIVVLAVVVVAVFAYVRPGRGQKELGSPPDAQW